MDIEYECSICKKKFTKNDFLNGHKKTVNEGKLYSCKVCNKSYRYRSSLAYHKETPVKCGQDSPIELFCLL